jgi:dimeric dUTPase (all-alpha-NTP-PPase superfamily)
MNNLHNMLTLQDRMNAKINPQWMTAGYAYLRAAAVEGAEALESLGWKWWKKQDPDMANVAVELVDIWHFILSEAIRQQGSIEMAVDYLQDEVCNEKYLPRRYGTIAQSQFYDLYNESESDDDISLNAQDRMELLIGLSALRAPLDQIVSVFNAIRAVDAKMSDAKLYEGYVSKNVLNFFRQDHGYKAGTYVKDWAGEEDNVVMTRLAAELTAGNDFSERSLYDALSAHYQAVLEARKLAGE